MPPQQIPATRKAGGTSQFDLASKYKKENRNHPFRDGNKLKATDDRPDGDENNEATRCKIKDCMGKTHVFRT